MKTSAFIGEKPAPILPVGDADDPRTPLAQPFKLGLALISA